MAEHYEVGDIVKLKKQIMVARKLVEKNTRGLRKKDA